MFGGRQPLIRRSAVGAGAVAGTDLEPLLQPGGGAGASDAGASAQQQPQPLIRRQAVAMPARGSSARLSAGAAAAAAGAAEATEAGGGPSGGVASGATGQLFVTFGNTAVWDFTRNWVLAVQALSLPFVVGALDRGMSQRCAAAGYTHLDLWREQVRQLAAALPPRLLLAPPPPPVHEDEAPLRASTGTPRLPAALAAPVCCVQAWADPAPAPVRAPTLLPQASAAAQGALHNASFFRADFATFRCGGSRAGSRAAPRTMPCTASHALRPVTHRHRTGTWGPPRCS